MNQKTMRRIASHRVLMPNGQILTLSVIEISSGIVQKCYPLVEESAFTEWFPGDIVIRHDEEGFQRAYYENKPIE